jgi:hypothetical protein
MQMVRRNEQYPKRDNVDLDQRYRIDISGTIGVDPGCQNCTILENSADMCVR